MQAEGIILPHHVMRALVADEDYAFYASWGAILVIPKAIMTLSPDHGNDFGTRNDFFHLFFVAATTFLEVRSYKKSMEEIGSSPSSHSAFHPLSSRLPPLLLDIFHQHIRCVLQEVVMLADALQQHTISIPFIVGAFHLQRNVGSCGLRFLGLPK